MNILGISGSLNPASSNSAVVRAAAALVPEGMKFTIYEGLGELPHFTPHLDGDEPPPAVRELRRLLRAADGVFVCTPEYAHGMPGSLKNAFDWVVSSGEFDGGKPAAALSASPSYLGGDKALAALTQTLAVLGAHVPAGASLAIPYIRKKLDAEGHVTDSETLDALRSVLGVLAGAIRAR